MPVFRGSPWQAGYGQQIGYGLGSLFRSMARTVMPMVKSRAKALGNIALRSGADFVGNVLAGRNVKESAKARTVEAANVAKRKAMNKLRSQTGSGKCAKRSRSVKRTAKKRKASISTVRRSQSKKQKIVKKRKASTSTARRRQTKRRKTAQDIFG
jgi:hypothetical protein